MEAVMATALKPVFSHITKDERVCGGKACIDATRIRVIDVVQAQSEGYTPEQIRTLFAVTLTLAQVYSALAYADENPREIAADFASEASAEAEIEALRAQYLSQRGQ
jgi:uncharacterized protein (DUF433 family)